MNKAEADDKGLNKIETDLEQRKEEWNKCLFHSGAKDAIVEDIDKAIKDNTNSLQELDVKLKDIDKGLKGFDEVLKAMKNNPDYHSREAAN